MNFKIISYKSTPINILKTYWILFVLLSLLFIHIEISQHIIVEILLFSSIVLYFVIPFLRKEKFVGSLYLDKDKIMLVDKSFSFQEIEKLTLHYFSYDGDFSIWSGFSSGINKVSILSSGKIYKYYFYSQNPDDAEKLIEYAEFLKTTGIRFSFIIKTKAISA